MSLLKKRGLLHHPQPGLNLLSPNTQFHSSGCLFTRSWSDESLCLTGGEEAGCPCWLVADVGRNTRGKQAPRSPWSHKTCPSPPLLPQSKERGRHQHSETFYIPFVQTQPAGKIKRQTSTFCLPKAHKFQPPQLSLCFNSALQCPSVNLHLPSPKFAWAGGAPPII